MRTEKQNHISPEGRQRARELRKSSTPAEQKLWQALINRNLGDYKFRRQHPIGPYIADFFCAYVGLIVEVDGGGHLDQIAYDQDRTDWLEGQGYHVIRFWNNDVVQPLPARRVLSKREGQGLGHHLDDVAQEIIHTCEQLQGEGQDG